MHTFESVRDFSFYPEENSKTDPKVNNKFQINYFQLIMKCRLLCLYLLLLFHQQLIAQAPPNDNCSGAAFIYLDPSGNICFNDSNILASGDGISNTCDAAAILPLPAGGHEVWYSYVVSGTVNTITVTPAGTNPAGKVSVTVLTGNCSGPGAVNVCNTAATTNTPASLAFTSTPGNQLWFYVTSLETDGEFQVCISSTNGFINPGLNCNNATALCNTFDFVSPGSAQPGTAPLPSCFNSTPVRPFWYKFTAGYNGPLEFSALPNGAGGFRWALFDISSGCPGTEIACNSIYDPSLPFGMSSTAVNCTSSPYCPPVNVISGNRYALMVDDTSQSNAGFNFRWGTGVILQPTAGFTVDSLIACGTLTADFTETSSYTTSTNWTFNYGDGSAPVNGTGASLLIPSHTYLPGTYIARLTLTQAAGCSNSFSRQIIVKPKPTAGFSISDDSLCYDGTNAVSADFSASISSPSVFYNWTFPNNSSISITGFGQATVFWSNSGSIPVGLQITENGCSSDTTFDTIYIFNSPTANFSLPDSGCTGIPVQVGYTGNASSTATYSWTYSGGIISNQTNQQFDATWNSSGSYVLSLAVVENGCLGFPFSDSIRIFNTPAISIQTPATVCEGISLNITPLATGATPGSLFSWDFGSAILTGGNPLDGSSGTFTWPSPGITYMTAVASSPEGCPSNKDSVSIQVHPKPNAGFSISDTTICGGDSAIITYTGSMPPAGNNFSWDFGNAIIYFQSPTVTGDPYYLGFPAPGNYPVSLVVNDNVCNSDTIKSTIYAGSYPVSAAGIDKSTCSKQGISIGTGSTAGYSYNWTPSVYLNNPSISNPVATVPVTGIADTTVKFIVSTTSGFCTLNDTMELSVKAVQQAFFIPPNPQCERGNSFTFTPYFGIVPGASQTWIINNDTISAPQVLSYNFSSSGVQNISLQTQTPGCLPDFYSGAVLVKPNPVVDFIANPLTGCAPLDITFTNLSPPLAGASYLWNFDDGIVSYLSNAVHTYTDPGNYLPTLTITSADTCSATDTLNIPLNISQKPNAVFNAQPLIASNLNPVFNFNAAYQNYGCYFDFGDGSGDSSCIVSHAYSDTGTYVVTLYTTNSGGCADTFSLTVEVRPNFSLYIPNAFTPNNDQLNDRLVLFGEGIRQFEMKVINRRGQVVWQCDDIAKSWSGEYLNDGLDCPSGVYVYEAFARDFSGKKYNFRGRITLVR